jgi:hypothetical protein
MADLAYVYGGMYETPHQRLGDHQYILYPPQQGPGPFSRQKSFDADIEYLHAQGRQPSPDDDGTPCSDSAHMVWLRRTVRRFPWVDALLLLLIVVIAVFMLDCVWTTYNSAPTTAVYRNASSPLLDAPTASPLQA